MTFKLSTTLLLAAFAPLSVARADSFMPPETHVVVSPSGTARVTVVPARLSCIDRPMPCEPVPRAEIERRINGAWDRASAFPLRNMEAPGSVLVSDDGLRLVTFDDYASRGYGPNVVVAYRSDGSVVKRMLLSDIVPTDYIDGLPRTASALAWAGTHRIEPGSHRAVVAIHLVDRNGSYDRDRSLPLHLDLDSGIIEKPAGQRWRRAQECAARTGWRPPDAAEWRRRARSQKVCR